MFALLFLSILATRERKAAEVMWLFLKKLSLLKIFEGFKSSLES